MRRLAKATCATCTKTWSSCTCAQKRDSRQAMLAMSTQRAIADPIAEPQGETQKREGTQAAIDHVGRALTDVRVATPNESPLGIPQGETPKGDSECEATGCDDRQRHYRSTRETATARPAKPPNTNSQQSIRRYGAIAAYWERQGDGMMCAMHAINCLLQRHAVDGDYLHAVAARLDAEEHQILEGAQGDMADRNARPDGEFTIQVIQRALQLLGGEWSLTDTRNPAAREQVRTAPQMAAGYIVNPGGALVRP